MKTKLTEAELEVLLPKIKQVLETGTSWKDETLHHPAGAIIAAVLTVEGVEKKETEDGSGEGFSTNGWQYDWWQHFTYCGKDFTLGGSGYHGGHAFHISER